MRAAEELANISIIKQQNCKVTVIINFRGGKRQKPKPNLGSF